ncbi:hypothetical protein V1524DRAFT_234165 [Lipomyces starkeyi]
MTLFACVLFTTPYVVETATFCACLTSVGPRDQDDFARFIFSRFVEKSLLEFVMRRGCYSSCCLGIRRRPPPLRVTIC